MPGTATRSPGRDVAGQELVLDHDVAGLAVPADHPGEHRRRVGAAAGQGAGVVGVVERGADVVAHAAVDGDVGAAGAAVERDLLDRADLVDRAHRRADDRPAGLDARAAVRRCRARGTRGRRSRSSRSRAARARTGRPGWCRRCRSRRRGPARAARPRARRPIAGVQRQHPPGGHLEARGVEDLAADVGVQPEQLERLTLFNSFDPPTRGCSRQAVRRASSSLSGA